MKIIGDVHGKVDQYREIIMDCEESICVGDFGFQRHWDWWWKNIPSEIQSKHWINMGNHDYLPYLHRHPSCGDWKFFEEKGIFTIRGAESIDRYHRTEGIDWFRNEQLTYTESLEVYDRIMEIRPKIIVSHDCPQQVMRSLFGYNDQSTTRQFLQEVFNEYQPELWIFGHHHQSKDARFYGTRFVCLTELETFDL